MPRNYEHSKQLKETQETHDNNDVESLSAMAPHGHGHGSCGHSHGHALEQAAAPSSSSSSAAAAASFQIQPRDPAVAAQIEQHQHANVQMQSTHELTTLEELFASVKRNDLPRVQALVTSDVSLIQARDALGHTLMHWAAMKGGAELLTYLASVNAPLDLPSGDTVKLHPIHWACSAGNLVALKTLVKLGVDVNCADALKQRTPLLLAAQNGYPLLVMYLIRHGADVTLVDIDDDSAIHWAAYKGATEIVSVFQYLGLRTDSPDKYGQTPLHLAAMRGELATVQYLVEELESDMQALDQQGRSPYDLAVLKGYRRVSTYLARQMFRSRWNVLAWWEASRTPYYYVLANFALATALYIGVLMPAMRDYWSVCVPHMIWNALTIAFFVLTTRTSAGDVTADAQYATEYAAQIDAMIGTAHAEDDDEASGGRQCLDRPLCHSCYVQRPLRSKHCRVCKTCIDQFDHHCPFVDNCVGKNNYVYFMGFVTTLTLDLVLVEYVLGLYTSLHGVRVVVVLALVYFGVMLLSVAHLCGFHVYLTAKNLTTNEVMNRHRYAHMRTVDGAYQNPFDRGLVQNVAERCLPAFHSSSGSVRRPSRDRVAYTQVEVVADTELPV